MRREHDKGGAPPGKGRRGRADVTFGDGGKPDSRGCELDGHEKTKAGRQGCPVNEPGDARCAGDPSALAGLVAARDAALTRATRELGRETAARRRLEADKARLLRELDEAVRLRDEFFSIASHELKTPLTALHLQLQAILGTLANQALPGATPAPGGPTVERVEARVRIALRQIDRLSRLVDALLDFTRFQSGSVELEIEQLDLREVLHDVSSRLAEETRRAQTPITLRVGGPLEGRWDRLRLEQVFTNLLSNAIKFGAHKPIEIVAERGDDVVRVYVRDQGIGVAPEDHERIFHRFGRAVSGLHYGGFGVGLWMAREAVRALGGEITVTSRLGQGATFTVLLPASGVPADYHPNHHAAPATH